MAFPLAAVVLLAFSTHPRSPYDLSALLDIADALLVPFLLFAACAVVFGLYALGRVGCRRILVSRVPSFFAGVLFPFAAWFVFLLDFAVTGRQDIDLLKFPAMLASVACFSEITIVRRYFGCGIPTGREPLREPENVSGAI